MAAASTKTSRQQRAEARRLASLSTEEIPASTLKTEQQPTTAAAIDNESKMEEEQPKLESRQESKSNDDTPFSTATTGDDSTERVPSPPSTVDAPTPITNDAIVNDTNVKKEEATKELQPAFNLQDIGTIQDQLIEEQIAEQTTSKQSSPRGRPASRSSSMTREGRPASRASSNGRASPNSYNGAAVSRRGRSRSPVGLTPHPSSRSNSLSSRPTSRAGSLSRQGSVGRQGGRESAATIQVSNNNNINSNEQLSSAALAAGESAALYNANPLPYYNEPNFGHSLPTGRMEGRARSPSPVSRFPNTNSMSFEMSPNQSMSFGNDLMAGLAGFGESFDWNVGTSPVQQGRGTRSPSPSQRYEQHRQGPPQDNHGYYNYPPPPMSSQGQAPPQAPPQAVGGYNPSTGYHPNASGPSQYHTGHYNSSNQQGSRRHSRSSSPVSGRNSNLPRRNSQQALFPEHHVHSPGREGGPQGSSGGRASSRSRSTSPIKKPRRSSPERSSVFRGNPTPGQTNLPQELLLALEEEDSDTNSPPNSPQPKVKKVVKKKNTKSKKSTNKSSTKSKGKGKGKKSRGKELPPTSSSDALSSSNLALSSNPSMLLDSTQIDACLQDLSFRKSYELEQMFSFINTDGNNLGMSFNMGFSGEEGDDTKGYTPINSFSNGENGGMAVEGREGGMEYLSSPAKAPKSPKATSRDPPVVHTTPPSYGGGHHNQGSSYPSSSNGGMGYSANTHTPPPSSYENHPHHIPTSFPSKRIKVSTRHTLHPLALDLTKRGSGGEGGGDYFSLLRKLAPAFVGFRFKLPEMMEMSNVSGSNGGSGNIVGQSSSHSTLHMTMIDENQMIIAKRRINSSICAFGGSLPPRTVSPTPSYTAVAQPPLLEESTEQRNERYTYESSLASRYFMKEHCISWDVELHEVIAPKAGSTPKAAGKKDKKATAASASATSTPKMKKKKQIGVFKAADAPGGGKYCAPVTPSSPPAEAPPSTPGTPSSTKTTKSKSKYRCKLCGLPKQNHKCTYKNQVVRSIGTMVYPAVNAFVSNEPGRLAPALSEMNNFTSLLSQDTTMTGSQYGGGTSLYHRGPHGGMNLLTPDTSHWAPTTPGGLSTMSSTDPNSPATPHQASSRKRDHNHLMMSRTMSALSPGSRHHHPVVPHVPSMPPAPAGAIPNDVLFRDTMELKIQQYRTVGAVRSSDSKTTVSSLLSSPLSSVGGVAPHTPGMPPQSATPASSSVASSSAVTKAITESVTAYRYPQIPTPYTQRKEMGDTLFALSREVPNLADSCASILREARESDDWDQAVAELTTQVLIVLKCEEMDYTLDGLRRHLLGLGIAC